MLRFGLCTIVILHSEIPLPYEELSSTPSNIVVVPPVPSEPMALIAQNQSIVEIGGLDQTIDPCVRTIPVAVSAFHLSVGEGNELSSMEW